MTKKILILCCGYPYSTDTGFGCHVAKELEKMELAGKGDAAKMRAEYDSIAPQQAEVRKMIQDFIREDLADWHHSK